MFANRQGVAPGRWNCVLRYHSARLFFQRGQRLQNLGGLGPIGYGIVLAQFAVTEHEHAFCEQGDVWFVSDQTDGEPAAVEALEASLEGIWQEPLNQGLLGRRSRECFRRRCSQVIAAFGVRRCTCHTDTLTLADYLGNE